MPQLDVFIFFSQYFVFVILFLFFYLLVVKMIVKNVDSQQQLIKRKIGLIYNTAASIRMIVAKSENKTRNFLGIGIQNSKTLKKKSILEFLIQKNLKTKYAFFWLNGYKQQKINSLKIKNYILK